ncbi:hypothetical protein [Ralstonia phage Reminis]|uniref:dATP/dGTP diphosphohydrolase N-terminal domain-containing protein n=1 Tax=Ralstonia phage Reminis TaxID=2662139 RepID=A0A5Q2UBX9_9CAUD|nr:hypothetical protein [Ralstonia phage Reminis]
MRKICTCSKRAGVRFDTVNGHALDCAINLEIIDEINKSNKCEPVEPVGAKYDAGKPRVDLLIDGCPLSLEEVSKVLTFGSKKYADHNWQKVPEAEKRYKAAMMRHVLASAKGEKVDDESSLSHLAHAACCILFMLELELRNGNKTL